MKSVLEKTENLRLIQAEIVSLNTVSVDEKTKRVCSVTTKLGEEWACDCVIIATGTYLESAIFVGNTSYEAGPDGLLPAKGLSDSLAKEGVKLLRFKTGTPARVKRSTIDFSKLEEQPGESPIIPYSALTDWQYMEDINQISCHIVYTNAETHRIIRENITRSAMYSGKIHGSQQLFFAINIIALLRCCVTP